MASGALGQCGAVDFATMDMVMLRCLQAERNRQARQEWYHAVFQHEGLLNHQLTDLNAKFREMPDQVGAMTRAGPVPNDVPIPLKLTIGTPPGLSLDCWKEEASTEASSNAWSTGPKAQYEDKKLGSSRPMRAIEPGATTLLVRNVPSRYTHKDLLEEWADEASNFDMIYRPYSLAMKRNLGHAVMNFVSHEAAVNFQIRFHGKCLKDHGRTRALDIAQSEVQGYEANLLVLRRKVAAIKNESCLPVVLSNGRVLDTRQEVERVAARLR